MIHTQTRKYIPVLSTGLGYRHKPHALRPASKRARKGKKQGKRKEKKRMKEGQGSRSAKLYASCILHPFIPSGRSLPQHHHHRPLLGALCLKSAFDQRDSSGNSPPRNSGASCYDQKGRFIVQTPADIPMQSNKFFNVEKVDCLHQHACWMWMMVGFPSPVPPPSPLRQHRRLIGGNEQVGEAYLYIPTQRMTCGQLCRISLASRAQKLFFPAFPPLFSMIPHIILLVSSHLATLAN